MWYRDSTEDQGWHTHRWCCSVQGRLQIKSTLYNFSAVQAKPLFRWPCPMMTRLCCHATWEERLKLCVPGTDQFNSKLNSCQRLCVRGLEIPAMRKETNARQLALRLFFYNQLCYVVMTESRSCMNQQQKRQGVRRSVNLLSFASCPVKTLFCVVLGGLDQSFNTCRQKCCTRTCENHQSKTVLTSVIGKCRQHKNGIRWIQLQFACLFKNAADKTQTNNLASRKYLRGICML